MNNKNTITVKIISFVGLITMLAFANITYVYMQQIQQVEIDYAKNIRSLSEYLVIPVEDFIVTGNETNLRRLIQKSLKTNIFSGIVILDRDGSILASFPEKIDFNLRVKEFDIIQSFESPQILSELLLENPASTDVIGKMVIYLNENEKNSAIHRLKKNLTLSTLATIIVILLSILYVRKNFIQPIKILYRNASAILDHKYDQLTPIDQRDEIGKLSDYLNKIARNFNARDAEQLLRESELLHANASITSLNNEKNAIIYKLLDSLTPPIEEALNTVNLLKDKSSIQANLMRSLLYTLSLTDEAKSIIQSGTSRIVLKPEKVSFKMANHFVREYVSYFSSQTSTPVILNIQEDPELNNRFLIVDKKQIMRLFSHIFEILESLSHDNSSQAIKLLCIYNSLSAESISVDLVITYPSTESTPGIENILNTFFKEKLSETSIKFFKTSLERVGVYSNQAYSYIGLKALIDRISARYSIIRVSPREVMHTFNCVIKASSDESYIETAILNYLSRETQNIYVIGAPHFINKLKTKQYVNPHRIRFITFEQAEQFDFKSDVHYIIDLMNARSIGLEIAKRVLALDSKTHNVAAVIPSNELRENTFFQWCDLDFDMLFYDTATLSDINSIFAPKITAAHDITFENVISSIKSTKK